MGRIPRWREAWRRARAAPDPDPHDTAWRTDEPVRRRQVAVMVVVGVAWTALAVWGFSHGTELVLEDYRGGPLPGWLVGGLAAGLAVGTAGLAWRRRRRP